MRHLIGFGLALVLAAAVFFGAAWGYLRLLRLPVVNGAVSALPAGGGSLLHSSNVLLAFAALSGAAILAGIWVAAPRISPLAAGLPGLVLIAWTILYGVSVRRAVRYIPLKNDAFGTGFEALLFNGMLAAVGFVLIIPLFVPSRWRRRVPPGYGQPGFDQPAYRLSAYGDAAASGAGLGSGPGSGLSSGPGSPFISSDWSESTATMPQPQPPLVQPPPDDPWQ